MPQCERVAGNLKLIGDAEPVPLGPDEAYAKQLGGAIGALNSARSRGRRRLGAARSGGAQAAAASGLASSYAKARAALRRPPAGPLERRAHAEIVAALRDIEGAYRRLGAAARRSQEGRYRSAVSAVRRGEARLQAALRSLQRAGYEVG